MTDLSITAGWLQRPDPRRIDLPCGGTARDVIELTAEPAGGWLQRFEVTGWLRIGHTADLANPAEPVYIADKIGPGTTEIDLRCLTCDAQANIGRFGGDTLVVLTHDAGCPALAALAEVAK